MTPNKDIEFIEYWDREGYSFSERTMKMNKQPIIGDWIVVKKIIDYDVLVEFLIEDGKTRANWLLKIWKKLNDTK